MDILLKAQELLSTQNINIKNDDHFDQVIDRVDDYFFDQPDSKLFQQSRDSSEFWATYFTDIFEDLYNVLNNYNKTHNITQKDLDNLTKLVSVF